MYILFDGLGRSSILSSSSRGRSKKAPTVHGNNPSEKEEIEEEEADQEASSVREQMKIWRLDLFQLC